MQLDDKALRLAIAEELGWVGVKTLDGILWGIRPTGILTYEGHEIVPNWPSDIAAAMGLEDLFQDDKERARYAKCLYEIVEANMPVSIVSSAYIRYYWLAHATARQRSEAWLTARRNKGTGNVGIGMSSPGERLDVVGNARIK